ncbi:protein LTO1 homolog isoform X2 [Macrotis lagotis]|uniref:protein LTO1 homolog isoform X2 n=1 Tax=Macrotis lagotis TaxID=92651 RepID=UPI003D69DEA2
MERAPDLFDAIVMAEERYRGEGYREGYAEGGRVGLSEGRRHGVSRGAGVGSEIGCYRGFAFTWKCLLSESTAEKDRGSLDWGVLSSFPPRPPLGAHMGRACLAPSLRSLSFLIHNLEGTVTVSTGCSGCWEAQ